MHNWSLIRWEIHSLTIQNCILEGCYLLKAFSQPSRLMLGTQRGSTWGRGRVWKLCGTQPELQGLAGSSTPVLVGREGTCLLPLRLEAGFAAAAGRMEMCWAGRHCLLHGLLSSCEVRAPLLTCGIAHLGNLLQFWSCGCWQRQLQGEQDTPYTFSIPLLLPPDLLLVWAEVRMPELPATSPPHRSARCTQVLLLQKSVLPDLYESQAVKVIWRAGRKTAQKTACSLCWCP